MTIVAQKLKSNPHFHKWLWAGLSLICLVLLVLVLGEATMPKPKTIEIGQTQVGSLVELKTGDQLQLSLEGNLTTGYNWKVAELDTNILKLSAEPQFQADSSALGSGGKVVFRFETVNPGKTPLKLIYYRPFEKDTATLRTYEVTVVLK